jgi:low affinity Fe/Cu permease
MSAPAPPVSGHDVDRRRWVDGHRDALEAERAAPRWRRGLFRGVTHHRDWRSRGWESRLLHRVGEIVSNAASGVLAAVAVTTWAVVGAFIGFPGWWQTVLYSVTASITFVMVFVIQHTQTRQTTAMQRKLDELIRAAQHSDNSLIAVEEAPDDELQALADLNLHDRSDVADTRPSYDAV